MPRAQYLSAFSPRNATTRKHMHPCHNQQRLDCSFQRGKLCRTLPQHQITHLPLKTGTLTLLNFTVL